MNEEQKNKEEKDTNQHKFTFTKTISCPNCPINCFSIIGAIKHEEECNGARKKNLCCICKKEKPNYYDPKKNQHWFLCLKCYGWAKNKSICL